MTYTDRLLPNNCIPQHLFSSRSVTAFALSTAITRWGATWWCQSMTSAFTNILMQRPAPPPLEYLSRVVNVKKFSLLQFIPWLLFQDFQVIHRPLETVNFFGFPSFPMWQVASNQHYIFPVQPGFAPQQTLAPLNEKYCSVIKAWSLVCLLSICHHILKACSNRLLSK